LNPDLHPTQPLLQCSNPILISLTNTTRAVFQQVKQKKFCNQSCAAKYNNTLSTSPRNKPKIRLCVSCGEVFTRTDGHTSNTRCPDCGSVRLSVLPSKTKSECRIEEIRRHARITLFKAKPRSCQVCGYSFHVDACHINPIRLFPATALVSEINALPNLAALCKNHHDELDKGAITL